MTDITYHAGEHLVNARLSKFEANENHKQFCSLNISFTTQEGYEVSSLSILVPGDIEEAKTALS
jgi:hypothetical protein